MAKAKAAGAKRIWQAAVGGLGYMGISLHSRNHRGEALAAMVDWINREGRFNEVMIGLSDTLNRHNYARDHALPLRDAYRLAANSGDRWLDENADILNGLDMPHRLVRWSHWLEAHQSEVEENRLLFDNAYRGDPAFRASIDADISAFLSRKGEEALPEAWETCRAYLIEELAVYSVILREFPATVVYPGRQLNCFAYMRDQKPENLPASIGRTSHVRLGIHGLQTTGGAPANNHGPTRQVA